MPKFERGNNGRPKGSKNKQQFSLTYWYNLILADYSKLKPLQRSKIALDCWKTLISKAKTLPLDPDDSLMNVNDAMGMLKEIEKSKGMLTDVKTPPNDGGGPV